MPLTHLDHVNIRTCNLAEMIRFYTEIVGLKNGNRPQFAFSGAWLYCGDRAAVHLVEVADPPQGLQPKIEHFAFMASDLSGFLKLLTSRDVPFNTRVVAGVGNTQVNIHDPDGNHIEIQFDASESA